MTLTVASGVAALVLSDSVAFVNPVVSFSCFLLRDPIRHCLQLAAEELMNDPPARIVYVARGAVCSTGRGGEES